MRRALLGQATPGIAWLGNAQSSEIGSGQLRLAKVWAEVLGSVANLPRRNLGRGACGHLSQFDSCRRARGPAGRGSIFDARADKAALVGEHNGLNAVADVELLHHVGEV